MNKQAKDARGLIVAALLSAVVWFALASVVVGAERVAIHEHLIGTKSRNCSVVKDQWPGGRTRWVCKVNTSEADEI